MHSLVDRIYETKQMVKILFLKQIHTYDVCRKVMANSQYK